VGKAAVSITLNMAGIVVHALVDYVTFFCLIYVHSVVDISVRCVVLMILNIS